MRRAEDEDVALLEDAVEADQPVVDDVRVGGEDAGAGPRQELAQLVAERRARVVRFGLEGHPQDADGLAVEAAVATLEGRHDVGRQALVDLHRGLAEREVIGGEGRQLHRVLEQARAGGEAGAGQVGGARVVLADRAQDVRVVDPGLVGDHEELVGHRELHVAPGVGEQLRQLGFLGRRPDRLAGERPEQLGRPLGGAVVVGADDLRQRVELLEGMALGDPLRAERHVDPAAALGEVLRDVAGRARVDGAAQGDQRPVAEVRRDLVDGLLEDRHRWPEELVDRGADDDDEVVRPLDHRAVGAEREPAGRQDLAQQLVRAGLHERHLAGGDPVEGRLVRVVDADAQARLGEGEAERQADVPAAAEDDDVEVRGSFGHGIDCTSPVRSVTGTRRSRSAIGTSPDDRCVAASWPDGRQRAGHRDVAREAVHRRTGGLGVRPRAGPPGSCRWSSWP